MKPIILNLEGHDFSQIKHVVNGLNLKNSFMLKKTYENKLHILTKNYDDKNSVLNYFKINNDNGIKYLYHTFTENEDKSVIFVLKNHFYVETDELLKKLTDAAVPAIKVTFLNSGKENPSYLVHFQKNSVTFYDLVTKFKVIENLIIKWEKFNKKKRISQCHNCQEYGHSASNCGKQYKCVKCINEHLPGQCNRKDREGDPQCVNCKGQHAANSRLCSSFMNYKQKIVKLQNIKKINTTQPREDPIRCYINPRPEQGYAYQIKTAATNPTFNTNQTSNKSDNSTEHANVLSELRVNFNSIPNINVTLQLYKELITKLKSTDCQKTRLAILIEYTLPLP